MFWFPGPRLDGGAAPGTTLNRAQVFRRAVLRDDPRNVAVDLARQLIIRRQVQSAMERNGADREIVHRESLWNQELRLRADSDGFPGIQQAQSINPAERRPRHNRWAFSGGSDRTDGIA